jgi:AraC-like DNA-binding protein
LSVIRDTVDQIRIAALTPQRGLEWFRLSRDKQRLLALLIDERMRRASQLNTDINKDLAAGRIRTYHAALSAYSLVLNQVMEHNMSFSEVASAIGYGSESSFSRVFRREMGVAPRGNIDARPRSCNVHRRMICG